VLGRIDGWWNDSTAEWFRWDFQSLGPQPSLAKQAVLTHRPHVSIWYRHSCTNVPHDPDAHFRPLEVLRQPASDVRLLMPVYRVPFGYAQVDAQSSVCGVPLPLPSWYCAVQTPFVCWMAWRISPQWSKNFDQTFGDSDFLWEGSLFLRNLGSLFSGLGESNRDGLFASLHASALAALSAFQCPALAPPHRTFDSLACGLTVFAFAFPFRWHGIPLLQFKTRPDRLGVGPARRLGPGKWSGLLWACQCHTVGPALYTQKPYSSIQRARPGFPRYRSKAAVVFRSFKFVLKTKQIARHNGIPYRDRISFNVRP